MTLGQRFDVCVRWIPFQLRLQEFEREARIAGHCGFLQLAPPLRKIMFCPYWLRREWSAAIFGPPLTPSLAWEDYDHVGTARDLAACVLAGAKKHGAAGINILLHGPVGTGKTEFCKTLAARCGLTNLVNR
jgi:hypothetical protein